MEYRLERCAYLSPGSDLLRSPDTRRVMAYADVLRDRCRFGDNERARNAGSLPVVLGNDRQRNLLVVGTKAG